MWPLVALAGLSAAGSFISSKGAADASAKQGRLQMMEDARQRTENQALARELMAIPEITDTENRLDLAGFMRAGEAAGYNPVTWLNSGALSAFTHSTKTTTGANTGAAMAMMQGTPTQIPRVASPLEGLGGALSAGVNTFGSLYKTQMALDGMGGALPLRSQASPGTGGLYNTNDVVNGLMGGVGFAPRSYSTAGGAAGRTAGMSSSDWWPLTTGAPYPDKVELGKNEQTNPGTSWWITPGWNNAQGWEDAYSDIGGNIYGLVRGVNDLGLNVTGMPTFVGISNTWKGYNWNGSTRTSPASSMVNAVTNWWNSPAGAAVPWGTW